MSTFDPAIGLSRARSAAALLPAFAATIFLSATLLFSVQPMFTKMVLPLLGGSPSVWSVAMVFFQGVLLAGYGYAHAMTHWLDPRRVAFVHLGVIALAFVALPIVVASGWGHPPADHQALWLIGLFGASIGLPFFAVAANAPLLQAWFARTTHRQAHDPYFLYGASNLGSFASLLAYPFLLEPILTLREQSSLWTAGFGLLGVMIAGCAILMTRNMSGESVAAARETAAAPTWADRAKWVALSFVPSALLIAVTSHVSTDIASAPFLWVIPLALYLLTFVLTFRTNGDAVHLWLVRLQPIVVAPLVIGLMGGARAYWFVAILLSVGTFMISTMICHRELYLRRPDASHLTGFYMWVSAGGVLGGIFSGLFAPFAFPDVWEYPILIVAALLCRPGAFDGGWRVWSREGAICFALLALALVPRIVFGVQLPASAEPAWMIFLVFLAAAIMLQANHAPRLAGLTVLTLVLTVAYRPGLIQTDTARSFFGVHKVIESADGRLRMLYHGTTLHGAQRIRDDAGKPITGKPEPLTYYYHGGLFAEAINATHAKHPKARVALVGLGAGSLACYARAGDKWTYFEIDPEVVRIARDPSKFSFLPQCAPDANVVIGDARLTLSENGGQYDLIMLDAFSSDVVPVHLLTREALAAYMQRLAPGGMIAFHISNRYLELASVLREAAGQQGLSMHLKQDKTVTAGLPH